MPPPSRWSRSISRIVTRPSLWPLVAAVAVGILAVGLAVGGTVVTDRHRRLLIATAGWCAQAWREDPSFTPREGAKLTDRLIAPLALPVLALALVAVIVISMSRVLLAVPKDASVAVAGGLAVLLLAGFFVLASRPRLARTGLVFLSVVCGRGRRGGRQRQRGQPATAPSTTPPRRPQGTVDRWPRTPVQGASDHGDGGPGRQDHVRQPGQGTYHNIAVYTAGQRRPPDLERRAHLGVKKITYQHMFNLQPGTYSFRCDFHPTSMIGTFTVRAGP